MEHVSPRVPREKGDTGMTAIVADALPPLTFNLVQDAQNVLQYDFMRQALLAGTILSIVAGLVGYVVVLRHQAFAGEALSDVAFTGALGGAAFGVNPLLTLLVTTILAALGMGLLGNRLRGRDVAIGTVLAWILGLGVLFLSIFTMNTSGNGSGFSGVTVLFGNILGISTDQLHLILLVSSLTVLALAAMARPLLFASLDPDVATARGVPVRLLGFGFLVLLAVTVSEATLAVGALLVFALLLLPAAIAQRLTTRPYRAWWLAAFLAMGCTWLGITIGFYTGYPSSVCISLLAVAGYVVTVIMYALIQQRASRRNAARRSGASRQ
jgi:zinc/manganese transport system permease protein